MVAGVSPGLRNIWINHNNPLEGPAVRANKGKGVIKGPAQNIGNNRKQKHGTALTSKSGLVYLVVVSPEDMECNVYGHGSHLLTHKHTHTHTYTHLCIKSALNTI
ncbi:unnamed protein product [Lota lota]